MVASWKFPETSPFGVQGRDLSEDNFAQEERSSLEILMREALQNTLDARAPDNTGSVRVNIQVLTAGTFNSTYLQQLISKDYLERLQEASGGESLPNNAAEYVIVIEDFGTIGLQGTYNDLNVDGAGENWNAFWFREGEGAKSSVGSNGRAGQGKITYYRAGLARAVFGCTVRKSDQKQLLMGRSAFRRVYQFNGKKYLRHAFWTTKDVAPMPEIEAANIEQFKKAFCLKRTSEPGLSLVIPFAAEFNVKEAVETVIAEFFYPIARGRLEVVINDNEITAANVNTVANAVLSDDLARQKKSAFSKGFRNLIQQVIKSEAEGETLVSLKPGWEKAGQLKEANFPEGETEKLRSSLEKGQRVSIRCPIVVKHRTEGVTVASFDVHLEMPDELDRVEEAYIRKDLLIGSERHLAGSMYLQKARGLTLIDDSTLSAFMADAEEPTHLKWNASRPRLVEDYISPSQTVSAVRHAMPRLLTYLSGGIVKRDVKALAKYFNKPAEDAAKRGSAGKKAGAKDTKTETTPPPPKRKPFVLDAGVDRVKVVPNGAAGPTAEELPMICSLELAYEGLDQNPFDEYDPFDFDLSDSSVHQITSKGVTIVERKDNRVEFTVDDPSFFIEVDGFESNIRLRARLNFTEKVDGTTIDAE